MNMARARPRLAPSTRIGALLRLKVYNEPLSDRFGWLLRLPTQQCRALRIAGNDYARGTLTRRIS